jgi:hypothetical protein
VFAGQDRPAPLGWGVMEVLVAAPQTALLGWWSYATMREGRQNATLPVALTLWTAGLTAHGIYTIARSGTPRELDEPPRHRAAVEWKVAPALVAAGPSPAAPGAVIFGRF